METLTNSKNNNRTVCFSTEKLKQLGDSRTAEELDCNRFKKVIDSLEKYKNLLSGTLDGIEKNPYLTNDEIVSDIFGIDPEIIVELDAKNAREYNFEEFDIYDSAYYVADYSKTIDGFVKEKDNKLYFADSYILAQSKDNKKWNVFYNTKKMEGINLKIYNEYIKCMEKYVVIDYLKNKYVVSENPKDKINFEQMYKGTFDDPNGYDYIEKHIFVEICRQFFKCDKIKAFGFRLLEEI